MLVRELVEALERIAPPEYAEGWDPVGLHLGRPDAAVSGPVLFTIDLTETVAAEAVEAGVGAVVAYHPPIFKPVGSLTSDTAKGRILLTLAEKGIPVYTPHTAIDAAPGGVTDWLCDILTGESGSGDVRALTPWRSKSGKVKIVTFVPAGAAEAVRNAMASGGAGIIGDYRVCSFSTPGTGTFYGGEGTDPAVGESGRLESAEELRLEMIASSSAVPLVVATLREFHPYEEPAIDVYPLEGLPRRGVGSGRRLTLDQPVSLAKIGERLRRGLGAPRLRFALPEGVDDSTEFRSIGVVPGAGAELAGDAFREGCELFFTGEMRHHEIVENTQRGMAVLLAGHTNTERGYLPTLAARVKEATGLETRVAQTDRDPVRVLPD